MRDLVGLRAMLVLAAALAAAPGSARAPQPPSLRDSFSIGSGGGVLCQVQSRTVDPAVKGMFDRAWSLLCRDAASPVGRLYALRKGADDPLARLGGPRATVAQCAAPTAGSVPDLAGAQVSECRQASDVGYRVYSVDRGRTIYVAEGLAGYDSALQLALRTIVADHIVPGEISAAATAVADPAAFARAQAGSLDLDSALAEGYRRNNSGSYAEAAEFFDTLLQRASDSAGAQRKLGEYVVNRALQKSNLGAFAEADALFAQADAIPTGDPVQIRLRRNFKALHLLNQRLFAEALTELDRPLQTVGQDDATADALIAPDVATLINSDAPLARQLGVTENVVLTPQEKAAILDAQASQLRGTALRLQGDGAGAEQAFNKTLTDLAAIREGRVTSIARVRAQTLSELAAVNEARQDYGAAERLLREAVAVLAAEYPGSAALNAANARLAAYFARRGQTDAALSLYREVVQRMTADGGATTGFEKILAPYFALLTDQLPARPALIDDFFLASETLIRPGVADTQAVLARELSGGSDEAARLFRQSVTLTRDIERGRVTVARLAGLTAPRPEDQTLLADTRAALAALEANQVATQAKLSQFPRYRAISTEALTLADLRATLRPGEAYMKTAIVGDAIYMILATPETATAWRSALGAADLDRKVDALRDSISTFENGQYLTYPYDVALARELYVALFEPADAALGRVKHLIFEPDGGLLRMPVTILIREQAGVDAYKARLAKPGGDEFDFTGLAWLGRAIDVSTAVSARGFRDVRNARPSHAAKQYLGFGSNAPVSKNVQFAGNRSVRGAGAGIDCNYPLSVWDRPISPRELNTAQAIIGAKTSNVITGPAFSDTALIARTDLADYRILHFATHGLVEAPRPECPARPALLTSFGDANSDGLLTFQEIYDLRLDADIVILSACDTAGKATVAATREAGVTSGGGGALDGLVRAFVGAGGRAVLASHWPAPDEYDATERLISGLFDATPGSSVVEALRIAQIKLMDAPQTSHPYYWADFSVIGDGTQPVLRAN